MRVDLSTIVVPFRDRLQINLARHSAAKTAVVIELTFPREDGVQAGLPSSTKWKLTVVASAAHQNRDLLSVGVTEPNAP